MAKVFCGACEKPLIQRMWVKEESSPSLYLASFCENSDCSQCRKPVNVGAEVIGQDIEARLKK